ncbi:hypothetical protein [Actinomadura rugatobispora]|uniref:Guanylate cyclase domain-containing protein n=1 Tax=Actinomadura rugatobispora TaxID=1994 RepID=A0ABW1AFJ4_9ACTN|nr:hypothetical protein GCM10010200_021790 [Actinomadura rugatobispora]
MNHQEWYPVPGYRGIVAVDAEGFSKRSDVSQEHATGFILDVLARSFERAGVGEVWERRVFPSHRGDGYAFGFDPAMMPGVIASWPATLQRTLMECEPQSGGPLRLRVSLHIGPLPVDGGPHDGSGTARNEAHRLLNADVLKLLLAKASREVTRAVVIVSDDCFKVAVRSMRSLHPDLFCEVSATLADKQFDQRAWIHVPVPSGNLLAAGIAALLNPETGPDGEAAERRAQGAAHVVHHTVGNRNDGVVGGNQSINFNG